MRSKLQESLLLKTKVMSNLSNPGDFTIAINTILDRTSHTVNCNIQSNPQFIAEWRKRLHELQQCNLSSSVAFLLKDASNNITDHALLRKCNELITKYANPKLLFTGSSSDIVQAVDTATINKDISERIGVSTDILREGLQRIIRTYIKTGEELQVIDAALQEKLNRIDAAIACINTLTTLDQTQALPLLAGPVEDYLKSLFEKNMIESTYNAYIETYKRFVSLRSIIEVTNIHKPVGPSCTICMTKEISYTIAPCGHTFCEDCSAKQLTSCYVCRTQIRDRLRIYY